MKKKKIASFGVKWSDLGLEEVRRLVAELKDKSGYVGGIEERGRSIFG